MILLNWMITGVAGFTASLMMAIKKQLPTKGNVVMPWKMVTRHGTNMPLAEAVDRMLNRKESEAKELERRNREREETEKKRKEYY